MDIEIQYYPVDEATDWIKNNAETTDRILTLFMSDYPTYVDKIYEDKNEINKERFYSFSFEPTEEIMNPLKNLMEFCYEQEISYIMFPFGPGNSFEGIGDNLYAKYLVENRNNELIEVAKFNHDDNYIFIYKIKE
jgi:hypothetical protein